jgi:HK97 family phage major capsid protein
MERHKRLDTQRRATLRSAGIIPNNLKIMSISITTERERVSSIHYLASKYNLPADLVRTSIDNGSPLSVVQDYVLNHPSSSSPPVATRNLEAGQKLGMSSREVSNYSIKDAINDFASNGRSSGIAREMSDQIAKDTGREAKGFFLPLADLNTSSRALSAGVASKGGYTVETQVFGGSMIEQLRNRLVLESLGVRRLTDLRGDVQIPKNNGSATAYWLGETEEVDSSDQSFGQISLTPKRVAANTAFSKQLLAQSSIDAENFIRDDLMRSLATAIDLAGIAGTGTGGEPLGIMNTTGVNSVTFGGSPTWAKVVECETSVAADNADIGSLGYLTTPAVRGAWKSTEKSASTGMYLWQDRSEVNGYQAAASSQVPDNKVIFGNFSDSLYALWTGLDIVVDPYTLKRQGLIECCVSQLVDFAVRHPESFCVSSDAGNQ